MTCIVGLVQDRKVYIGGDSGGFAGDLVQIRADPKVFRVGPFLIGFTSSFRMGQLLRYELHPPDQHASQSNDAFMVTSFVECVRNCFKAGGHAKKEHEQESGGTFLVGYRGQLYEIDDDYQVAVPAFGYAAVGSGAPVALGAISVLTEFAPVVRVRRSLEAAEKFNAWVRGPFIIESLDYEAGAGIG